MQAEFCSTHAGLRQGVGLSLGSGSMEDEEKFEAVVLMMKTLPVRAYLCQSS